MEFIGQRDIVDVAAVPVRYHLGVNVEEDRHVHRLRKSRTQVYRVYQVLVVDNQVYVEEKRGRGNGFSPWQYSLIRNRVHFGSKIGTAKMA